MDITSICNRSLERKKRLNFLSIFVFLLLLTSTFGGYTDEVKVSENKSWINDRRCFSFGKNRAYLIEQNLWAHCLLTGRKVPGTSEVPNLIPSWVNTTLFSTGQRFVVKNIGYIGFSHLFALLFENYIPDIKDVLLTTGSTRTLISGIKRHVATATQINLWYRNSLNDPVEREIMLNSLSTVRRLHLDGAVKVHVKLKEATLESKRVEILQDIWKERNNLSIVFDDKFWDALETDKRSSSIPENRRHFPNWDVHKGLPVSQFSLAMTQFAFAGLPVMFHRELGITQVTKEELEGFVHAWAVFGYALGINDEFNICLNENFEDTLSVFVQIYNLYFLPSIFLFDWRARVQLGVYLDVLHHMDTGTTPRLFIYRFLKNILKIEAPNIFRQLNKVDRKFVALVDAVMERNEGLNRFIVNRAGELFLDSNGYAYFGSNYTSDASRSRTVYYTKENLWL